jgi:hypothetical protein
MSQRSSWPIAATILLVASPLRAEPAPADKPAASAPASQVADPFLGLRVLTPREKLPPLASVRIRDKREAQDRSRKGTVTITIGSSPKGAAVYYGSKLLGTTPLALSAHRGSTPFDVVIRRAGYAALHSRIMRKISRGYFFKLNPAKLR